MIDSTPELNIVDYFPSTYAAYNAIFTNKVDLFYFIPSDFSINLKRAKNTFAFIGANASNFMVSSSAIKTIVMTSQFLSAQVLTKFLIKNGISKNSALQMIQPISGNFKWMFNPTKTYANFFVPFVLLAIFQQILMLLNKIFIIILKKRKNLKLNLLMKLIGTIHFLEILMEKFVIITFKLWIRFTK